MASLSLNPEEAFSKSPADYWSICMHLSPASDSIQDVDARQSGRAQLQRYVDNAVQEAVTAHKVVRCRFGVEGAQCAFAL